MKSNAFVFDYAEWEEEARDNDELDYFLNEVGLSLDPKDYYFNVGMCPDFQRPFATITPKRFFDDNGYQFDGHVTQEAGGLLALHPDYSEEAEGSVYAWDESLSLDAMKADLISRGLIFNAGI